MSELSDMAAEIQSAQDALRARIEKLFGAFHTTDFAAEFSQWMAAHDKIRVLADLQNAPPAKPTPVIPFPTPPPPPVQPPPPVTEKPAA